MILDISLTLVSLIEEKDVLLADTLHLAPQLGNLFAHLSRHWEQHGQRDKFNQFMLDFGMNSLDMRWLVTLTLLCCTLSPCCLLDPQFLLSILAVLFDQTQTCLFSHAAAERPRRKSPAGQSDSSCENGGLDVTLDLCASEDARSTGSRLVLQ